MQKVGRNDPCPCGSGKKYKKCCEEKLSRRKFHAEVISTSSQPLETAGTSKVSSLFFKKAAAPLPAEKPEEPPTVVM
ncbi:MAG: SEC-C metal-binding domain-containing protein [Chlamydiota bacterium]